MEPCQVHNITRSIFYYIFLYVSQLHRYRYDMHFYHGSEKIYKFTFYMRFENEKNESDILLRENSIIKISQIIPCVYYIGSINITIFPHKRDVSECLRGELYFDKTTEMSKLRIRQLY